MASSSPTHSLRQREVSRAGSTGNRTPGPLDATVRFPTTDALRLYTSTKERDFNSHVVCAPDRRRTHLPHDPHVPGVVVRRPAPLAARLPRRSRRPQPTLLSTYLPAEPRELAARFPLLNARLQPACWRSRQSCRGRVCPNDGPIRGSNERANGRTIGCADLGALRDYAALRR